MEMKKKQLPKRSEIPREHTWRLEDLYASDAVWEEDFKKVPGLLKEMEGFKGKLGQSARELLACLKLDDEISLLMERLFVYARMRRDEDNTNAAYQALADRAASLSTQVGSALSFIRPEILAIPEERIDQFLAEEKGLEHYRKVLEDLNRQRPHTLSGSEESLLAQAGELAQAPGNIFRMINNADMKFPSIKDEEGHEVEVTHGRFIQLMESQDRRVRQDAFRSLYSTYHSQRNTLASTLGASVKKDVFYARVRKHPSALEAALFPDKVPKEVYDNLIATVRENIGLMHRYAALRKKVLGLPELHMYDLYVPLVKDLKWEIPYSQAVEMVTEGMAPLGEEYRKVLTEGFTQRWVDVYENQGKTSGAYSWGAYGTHPYVLMNYQENLNNVFTLAHEMGHALHSYFSDMHQPYTYAQYTIFVAEVASTVNESLLMHHLLKTVDDKQKETYLVNHYLEQFRGTVFRQTMFAEFEKIIHEKVEQGEALTPDLLSQVYRELNLFYYGPEMVVDPEIDMEWARIPHFYNAFYVYKYATGFSAATALTKGILEEGKPAVDRYLGFLRSGGSDFPLNLLRGAGVDMESPEPIRQGLDVFKGLLDRMEQLAGV